MSQHASEIYSRLLLPKRHGYPLWVPEPHENLPNEYQVTIGDVGSVTANGGFDPLFNISASPDDPVNSELDGILPFERVVLAPRDIWTLKGYHDRGADIASTYIRKTITSIDLPPRENIVGTPVGCPSFHFTCSSSEGAILLLPDGACRSDLRMKKKVFRQHAIENALRWYRFANEVQDRDIPNGSLILVTGCDMAVSWGIASFSGSGSSNGVELNFTPSHVTEDTATFVYSWQTNCPAAVRTGPKHDNLQPIGTFSGLAIDDTQTLRGQERRDVTFPAGAGPFANARLVDASRGLFNDVGRDQIYNITYQFGEQPEDALRQGPSNTEHEDHGRSESPYERTVISSTQAASAEPEPQENNQDPIQNQCVFLRGYRITIREGLAAALMGPTKATSVVDARPQDFFSSSSPSSMFSRASRSLSWFGNMFNKSESLFGRQRQSKLSRDVPARVHQKTSISDVVVEQFPDMSQPEAYEPATIINKSLLDAFPQAQVAVTHDDDWIAVIGEDESTLPAKGDLLERIFQQFTPKVESGAVFLEHSSSSDFKGKGKQAKSTAPTGVRMEETPIFRVANNKLQEQQAQAQETGSADTDNFIGANASEHREYERHRPGEAKKHLPEQERTAENLGPRKRRSFSKWWSIKPSPSQHDKIVVVIGSVGSGKSTFIDCATCEDSGAVHHGLMSTPPDIPSVRYTHPIHGSVVFVDIPEFDEAYHSDMEPIVPWFVETLQRKFNIAAIIYLFNIRNIQITTSLEPNLYRFMGLCGQDVMPNLVIATTMWDHVSPEEGNRQENQLRRLLPITVNNGTKFKRFNKTHESAWEIIGSTVEATPKTLNYKWCY